VITWDETDDDHESISFYKTFETELYWYRPYMQLSTSFLHLFLYMDISNVFMEHRYTALSFRQ
jgi:hypothetical protein